MKRITLVLGVVAVMVAMLVALAAPAMAKDNGGNHNNGDGTNNRIDNDLGRLDNGIDNRADLDDEDFLVTDVDFSPVGFASDFDNFDWDRFDRDPFFNRFDRFVPFDNGFGGFEQEANSGDIDQSFDVSGSGDHSNQTVDINGTANTGNVQNQIGVTQGNSAN